MDMLDFVFNNIIFIAIFAIAVSLINFFNIYYLFSRHKARRLLYKMSERNSVIDIRETLLLSLGDQRSSNESDLILTELERKNIQKQSHYEKSY